MKYFTSILGLAFWLLFTFLLACTILGIVVAMIMDEYWKIPKKLLKVFDS